MPSSEADGHVEQVEIVFYWDEDGEVDVFSPTHGRGDSGFSGTWGPDCLRTDAVVREGHREGSREG